MSIAKPQFIDGLLILKAVPTLGNKSNHKCHLIVNFGITSKTI
ncbi:hypothetical protein ADICYQ_4562 [Cyclobacterium qasimii M12-11B]|uniref:Uncharacterized protein n=1 Tax=Cyclobacterium qasimii M12-11B TaxID=641524 RepID=S7WQM3_9BACT|nr:hypothetical protein ADICYQ_4562 [Cyclobacterium qasimii M12-11B]